MITRTTLNMLQSTTAPSKQEWMIVAYQNCGCLDGSKAGVQKVSKTQSEDCTNVKLVAVVEAGNNAAVWKILLGNNEDIRAPRNWFKSLAVSK